MNFSKGETIFKVARKTATRQNKMKEGEKAYHNRICHPRVRTTPTKIEKKLEVRVKSYNNFDAKIQATMARPGSRQP